MLGSIRNIFYSWRFGVPRNTYSISITDGRCANFSDDLGGQLLDGY